MKDWGRKFCSRPPTKSGDRLNNNLSRGTIFLTTTMNMKFCKFVLEWLRSHNKKEPEQAWSTRLKYWWQMKSKELSSFVTLYMCKTLQYEFYSCNIGRHTLHVLYSVLLVGCGKKSQISRDFQGQIRGKNGRFCGNFAGTFEASFAEKRLGASRANFAGKRLLLRWFEESFQWN